jgi:hypothetical protein
MIIILIFLIWAYCFYIIQQDNIKKSRKDTSFLFEVLFAPIIALWIISSTNKI